MVDYLEECRKQGHPCIPANPEPWFAVSFVAAHFLQLERASDFSRKCREAGIPIAYAGRKPMIRLSDVEKVCLLENGS